MKNARSTMRKMLVISLVVVMLVVTLGSGVASASSITTEPKAVASSDMGVGALCSYTVARGNTLYGIALRYGTSVWYLANINHIANINLIRTGMRLWVPCGHPGPIPPPPPPGCSYRVRAGDSLSGIARWYGTTSAYLAAVNHIANPNRIYAGQWLRVPCLLH
jgi:LysM repeat protein